MEITRQALRRVRTENAAKLRDFHDDGDGAALVLATTNEVTGRAREDDVSARTLLNAHRAKLADRIGFGFQLLIGVANTVCHTTLLIVGMKGLGNRRNETNMACMYYLGICFWYLRLTFVRARIIRARSKVATSATRPDDDHHLHRPLHWLAQQLTPLLMAPVGPVVEPLMDWFMGIDPFLFNHSSPESHTLRIPELTKALEDYEDREATRAADLRRSPRGNKPPPKEAAADDDIIRLPRCCFELFDGFRARAGVARAMSECTFLGGADFKAVQRGFCNFSIALIPIGLRCVGDEPTLTELACFASGVLYAALLIFAYCWRVDPVHHAARFLTSLADGFSIFTMSIVGFAPQVSTAELPLGVWLLLQAALLAMVLLFGIHLGIAWDNARWSSARRALRQPLVQRQFTGPMRHLHAARSWAAVWLWRVPKYLGGWLARSLFATAAVGMVRVSAFWNVDSVLGWYIGGTRYSRMVEGAVAGATTPEMKRAIAAAGKRVAEQSSPRVKEALASNVAHEWPFLGDVGLHERVFLGTYVSFQAPAALLPFAVVVASFFTADAAVVGQRWPPLLRLASMVSVTATLVSVALLLHLSRRFWGFRGWLVRGDLNYKKFLQELVALHRPPVSALLKRAAVHHSVLPADVVDDVVGPFVPPDELTDRLSLADCAHLGFGRPKQHDEGVAVPGFSLLN